jgi:phosphoglycerol transferase MdoB-like AlkP superfamily enzyme
MMKSFNLKRYSLLFSVIGIYILLSTVTRLALYILTWSNLDFSILSFLKIFITGFAFDIGAALFLTFVYSLLLVLTPKRWTGSMLDKILTYGFVFIIFFIFLFSFMAEFSFWDEFKTRFNFIAVDYLIYTYEVFENINQSYPLPLLISIILLLIGGVIFLLHRKGVFLNTFTSKIGIGKRLLVFIPTGLLMLVYILFVKNQHAEWSQNIYESELSKNGVYSFFAAYRSNELDFNVFYPKLADSAAFANVKKEILQPNQIYTHNDMWDIERTVTNQGQELYPNIVLICMESMSGEFLKKFGNKQNITPCMDSLAGQSIFFTNLYATGTRTVRGMEALTLCMPPTPGNSIIRRPDNENIFSIANVLKEKNYTPYFVYGGDGYFDNMNKYFGGQGFNIVDRNRGNPLSEDIKTERINISDKEVTFENAWGIADEDIYRKVIKLQDENYTKNKRSFYFVMTTSNHKPYSFPAHKIDMEQGTRESAVRYTDFALEDFLKTAKTKPWFANTVFLIVADHCANSAGKWEINISKHHIPAFIYNLNVPPREINNVASQIDLSPTLFGLLHWNYKSSFYGKDLSLISNNEERALIGNYRTLGLLKENRFTEINDKRKITEYIVNEQKTEMKPTDIKNDSLRKVTISYYQTASYRYRNGKMKNK